MSEPGESLREHPFDPPLRIIGRRDAPITSIDEWRQHAGPAGGDRQWVEGRSAYESARAWVGRRGGPAVPEEIENLLDDHPDTRGFQFGLVRPEARVPLDNFRGNTRNTDVLGYGRARQVQAVVSIEAKVDESFGLTLAQALKRARKRSRLPERMERLTNLVLGRRLDEALRTTPDLRYQLLHGVGAAILAAVQQDARQAVFIVHEFRTHAASLHRYDENARDWAAFLMAVGIEDLDVGELEPLGWRPEGVRCLLGKAVAARTST